MVRAEETVLQVSELFSYAGPVFRLQLFNRTVIVIGKYDAAVELLEKRSSIYSDRPRLPMAGEL